MLTPQQHTALDAVCRAIVPNAFDGNDPVDITAAVEARLEGMDRELTERLAGVLSLLDSRLIGVLVSGVLRRFSELDPDAAEGWLRGWENSRIAAKRTIFQALRRLVLTTYYGMESTYDDIGYGGPLHSRSIGVDWEGPALGEPDDEREPVLRVSDPSGWRAPTVTTSGAAPRPGLPGSVTEGQQLSSDTQVNTEVCVIGTGAGGSVVAARLAEAGYDVVLLEEGGNWTTADFNENEAQMTQGLYAAGGTLATEDLAISLLQGRCVGGGTTINWMVMLRTPNWVIGEWRREHGLDDFTDARMAALFDKVEDEVHSRAVPADAHSPNNRLILDGAKKLGWSATTAKVNARGCVRSGFCGLGCRYNAKQGALATYLPSALAAGARLFSDVRVDTIEAGTRPGSRKKVNATVLDRSTEQPRGRLTVDASVVVVAAGAIGTPAILQRSGLGGGGVGRYLRLHPTTAALGRYDRHIGAASGIPLSAICDEFLYGDDGYGTWIECPQMHPAAASVALPGFGHKHRERMLQANRIGSMIVLVRDGANRKASNGDVRIDRKGRPRIRYRLHPADRANMAKGVEAAARLHLANGALEVITLHNSDCTIHSNADIVRVREQSYAPNQINIFSAHLNGTCRMGTNPRTSGCTPEGQRHGMPGVYVADGSLLPTALGVNPQETIMAVASHVAEGISAATR